MKRVRQNNKKRMPSSMKRQKIDRNSETRTSQLDRISELPDSVISRILFFLSAEDAARTTVLSKNWIRIWHSLPVCDFLFDQSLFENNLCLQHGLDEKEKVQKFIDFVDESLSILLRQKVIVQSFTLNMKDYGDSSLFQNMITYWILLITKNRVKKLTLNNGATLPLLEAASSCTKKKFGHSKLSQGLKCLQELSLTLDIEKRIVKGLDRILMSCSSLETLILKGNMYRNSLSLSKLSLKNIRLEKFLSLDLSHATRHRVQISSPDLEFLKFCHIDYAQHSDTQKTSNDEVEIEIDVPHLKRFSYSGDIFVSFTSNVLKFSCIRECDLIISPCHDLNTSWFIQLRKQLEKFSFVRLTINIKNDALFQRHEIMNQPQEGSRGIFSRPTVQLLRINLRGLSNYEDLIDGLLWSCHPRKIRAYTFGEGIPFIKFFIRELVKIMTEESHSCCKDPQGFRCWRHYAIIDDISTDGRSLKTRLLYDVNCLFGKYLMY